MNSPKTTITRDLLSWLLFTLIVLGLGMGVANYWVSKTTLEDEMKRRATDLARAWGTVLKKHIWALDDDRLRDHFHDRPGGSVNMTSVRVLTEFEDPIYERTFAEEPNPITRREPVSREGVCIGYVEVSLSRKGIDAILATTTFFSSLMILAAALAIFLVTTVLMRTMMGKPLAHLSEEIRAIAHGDYARRLPEGGHREIDTINREVNAMTRQIAERTDQLKAEIHERKQAERALQTLRARLELQVTERTVALQRAYEDLDQETRERRHIQNEMLEIGRREQQRIGRDLHDALGQQLAGASFLLGSLEKRLRDRDLPEAVVAAEVGGHLRDAVAQTRRIAYGLAPTDISEEGLIDGLEALANETQSMFNVECTFSCTPGCHVTDGTVATHLYRIAQEALHNAVSHGKAKHTWISLAVDKGRGVLTLRDDGEGLARCRPSPAGMGLRIMHFRADTIGGKFDLSINDLGGVTITATFKDEPPA